MKKSLVFVFILGLMISLTACGEQHGELVEMESVIIDNLRCIIWADRTYTPFCVVSKDDRGIQIGYVDGDKDDRISEYKGHSADEWLVSWLPMDGGAMLLKEERVVDIPDGLEKEY